MSKVCTVCKEAKDLSEYHNNNASKDGKNYRCKLCDRKISKKYRESPAGQYSKRLDRIKVKFGLSEINLRNLMDKQRGCCDICGTSLYSSLGNANEMHIDHNHETGEVRGLLCSFCNSMLGQSLESPEILEEGAQYLKNKGYYKIK